MEQGNLEDSGRNAGGIIRDILRCKQSSEFSRAVDGEKESLFLFCQTFQNEREFSKLSYSSLITELLQWLLNNRVCENWLLRGGGGGEGGRGGGGGGGGGGGREIEHVRCVLMTLRLLLRDENHQIAVRKKKDSLVCLSKCFTLFTDDYVTGNHQKLNSLKELSNIFQKVFSSRDCIMSWCGEVPQSLVTLLNDRDSTLVQCCLCSLINICKSDGRVDIIAPLNPLPYILHLIQFSDLVSRQKASDLLLLLVSLSIASKEELKDLDGLPFCLRLLHSEELHILMRMVGVIERLCEDRDLQEDLRLLGGIPLLLSLLSRKFSGEMSEEKVVGLKSVICSTITQLATNDTISIQIVQENGVYILSKLIQPVDGGDLVDEGMQRYIWRALRYLYSSERNRKKFRKLFPPKLFELFIDMGHYVRDMTVYSPLVHAVDGMTESELDSLKCAVEGVNNSSSPLFTVGGYNVHELLGSGAFGNVYRVKKLNSENSLAMKEIKSTLPKLGSTADEKTASIGKIMNEVNIIKEQLHHPNVVLYHKCFEENSHLYIVMELIEGSTLSDIIASLIDKKMKFEENRIWQIFTQLTLGLRYLHKEKHVIHRDLKPSNIMVDDRDKLTITDFGLAKQKEREFSIMESTVGTISYWSPELVRNETYTEKTDIWAAGCILYQMATTQPPFQTTNILSLAKKIAEVDYPAIEDDFYSPLLKTIVTRCLTAAEKERPDSVELGALLAPLIMAETDRLAAISSQLQLKLEKERQRTLRHQQRYRNLKSLATPTRQETTPTTTRHESYVCHPPIITNPTSPNSPSSVILQSKTPPTHLSTTSKPHPPIDLIGMESGLHCSPVLFHKGMELAWDKDSENVFPELQMTSLPSDLDDNTSSDAITSSVKPSSSRVARGRSYSAIVPSSYNQRHHSGRGHGALRSLSTTAAGNWKSGWSLQGVGVAKEVGSPRPFRIHSSSSLLSLSSRHLREISDPISHLLSTLHRLLSLTLSSSSSSHSQHSSRLLVLDRYQRSLFHSDMSPDQIKGELHKLGCRSDEGVWLMEEGVWSVGPRLLKKAINELTEKSIISSRVTDELCTLTYDLLATIIDSLHSELNND